MQVKRSANMTGIRVGRCGVKFFPVVALIAFAAAPARGDDAELRRRVLDLNRVTGSEVIDGEVKAFSKDPKVKELIQTGVEIARAKDPGLAYNAALILARLAAQLKDAASSEILYHVCTADAARLQSTQKLEESYGELIDVLFENKKYAETVKVCRELLELRSNDGGQREVLVGDTSPRGDVDYIPDEKFDPAIGLRPGVSRLMIQAIAKQGKFPQALKMADKRIKNRDHWAELALKGWVQREAGQYADSARTYEDVLKRLAKEKGDQEKRERFEDSYHYILSNVYLEDNQLDKATEHLQALLERHPNNPGFNNDLGYIWADHDIKLAEAEKLILKALELDRQRRKKTQGISPKEDHDNGAYLDSLGWVYYKQKKYKEAKEVLLKAVEDKDSQHIEIYDHLGDVLMALGERSAALAAWRKGVELAGEGRREQQRKALVEKKLQTKK
jgi:tetratricopeptide (TPR) repeat protein